MLFKAFLHPFHFVHTEFKFSDVLEKKCKRKHFFSFLNFFFFLNHVIWSVYKAGWLSLFLVSAFTLLSISFHLVTQ